MRSDVTGFSGGPRRKRGRAPTTGDYVGLAETKRRLLGLTQLEQQRQEEMDPEGRSVRPLLIDPQDLQNAARGDELTEEMRRAPTADLGAVIFDRIEVI